MPKIGPSIRLCADAVELVAEYDKAADRGIADKLKRLGEIGQREQKE